MSLPAFELEDGLRLLRAALEDSVAEFRQGQWEAIHAAAIRRRKCLVIQRTGWGKRVVYFLAKRILRDQGAGPTLVISPLLALMRIHIENARRLGLVAETINSTNADQWRELESRIVAGESDVLLTIDEVHCISDWGHDFRQDYSRVCRNYH